MLQVILAILFWFFIPGFFLVNLIFPRKGELDSEYDELYRVALGIVLSIVIVVFMGFGLNSLGFQPGTEIGYFTAPYIWASLLLICGTLFALGWVRGAYPILGKLHPKLVRLPPPDPASVIAQFPREKEAILKFKELARKRETLRRRLKDFDRRLKTSSEEMRAHYKKRHRETLDDLKETDEELRRLEEERAAELY